LSAMDTVFVVNPHSAAGATLRRFERARPAVARALGDFDVKLTERAGHATELVREALRGGATRIVAVGGDGTTNEVVNGFFDETGQPIGHKARLGLMVSGTGGDFRRTFSWSTDPEDAIARLANDKTQAVDVGEVELTADDGRTIRRFFLNIASFGLSGAVDDVVNKSSKAFGAKASFISGTLRAFMSYTPPKVTLTLDEGESVTETISVVAVANGQYFGGGMWIAPHADVSDGAFSVVCVADAGKRFWLKNAARVYAGTHIGLDPVREWSAQKVRAEPAGSEPVLIDLDGEQPGRLPATFRVNKGALSLIV
jgi:YegS/Rv2252/BmrU family lipid kinase